MYQENIPHSITLPAWCGLCCCSPSGQSFGVVLCVQRRFPVQLGCNERLFVLAKTSLATLHCSLVPTRHFISENCHSLDIMSFSDLSLETLEMLAHENVRSAFSQICKNCLYQSGSVTVAFLPRSDASADCLDRAYMPKYVELLIRYFVLQSI